MTSASSTWAKWCVRAQQTPRGRDPNPNPSLSPNLNPNPSPNANPIPDPDPNPDPNPYPNPEQVRAEQKAACIYEDGSGEVRQHTNHVPPAPPLPSP